MPAMTERAAISLTAPRAVDGTDTPLPTVIVIDGIDWSVNVRLLRIRGRVARLFIEATSPGQKPRIYRVPLSKAAQQLPNKFAHSQHEFDVIEDGTQEKSP